MTLDYGIFPSISPNSTVIVSLSGVDETVTQMMYVRHTYAPQDILWNYRFVDLVWKAPDGDRYLDYKHFHDVIPLQLVSEP